MDQVDAGAWIAEEISGCRFGDARLWHRLRLLLEQLGGALGESAPLACQDWAGAKAAYRFLSNEAVSEAEILAGHFAATSRRFAATQGPILVLQDTTEFVYKRADEEKIGRIGLAAGTRGRDERLNMHTVCGLLMHASLAITPEGLPLGLSAVKFWSRSKFKGTRALKRSINPTRVPIEAKESIRWLDNMEQTVQRFGDPGRCVHIGDRENDIYEFFCKAAALGTNFLVRACVDRLAGEGEHTIADEMAEVTVKGRHHVEVATKGGKPEKVVLELRYKSIRVLPPVAKRQALPGADAHGPACAGEEATNRTRPDRLDADHQSSRHLGRGGDRKAAVVCLALED